MSKHTPGPWQHNGMEPGETDDGAPVAISVHTGALWQTAKIKRAAWIKAKAAIAKAKGGE